MAALKSEPLVKPLCIDAGVMGEQLDELAAFAARLLDRPSHELFADASAAAIGSDADVLDQTARGALRTQARHDAELQAADDATSFFRDHELEVRITVHRFKGFEVR